MERAWSIFFFGLAMILVVFVHMLLRLMFQEFLTVRERMSS